MSDLNNELIEQLLHRIDLLEKAMKKSKKSKKAKRDYDGDGKIESGTEEYMGSRDKAIKKAMGKKIEEALDRVGGNVNLNSPSIRSLASKIEKTDMVGKVLNKLNEGTDMNRKSFRDQGTKIQLSEKIVFGGFPKLINVVLSEDAEWSGEDPRKRLDAGKPARGQDYGIVDALRLMTTKIGHARSAGFKMANGEFPDEKMREETIKHLKNVSGNFVNSEAEVTDAYNFFRQHYPHLGVEDEIATKFDDIIKNHTPMPSEEE